MDNSTLKVLLQEYEQKRIKANLIAEQNKNNLYKNYPRLEEIENEINKLSIDKIKSILSSNTNELNKFDLKIQELQTEKEKIFKNANISANSLLPHYECKLCNDTGYISNGYKSVMCNCLKQKIFNIEYNKSNIGNIEFENFSSFSLNYYSDEINVEKYGLNISPRENIKTIKKISENFIKNFENPSEKNLLFTGNTGLGKTFLCNCIAYELLKQGKTVLYQTAPVMIDNIINCKVGKSDTNSNIIDNILNVDLLIIDDLGTETLNNMKLTELFTIINSRILNQNNKITKTIISTNLDLKTIFSIYNERIGSRFVGHYNICKFIGDDIRFKKMK